MMPERKYCQCCGTLISDVNSPDCDYYKHIRIKYCDICRETMKKLQGAARQYDFRQRTKQTRKLRDERLQLLEEENELLRERIICLREQNDRR